jgi:hypothetical protein
MKLSSKSVIGSILVVALMLSFIGSVYAITGNIGNGRMILRPDIGDTVKRSINVINSNEVTVDIKMTATGDLADDIKIIDSEFELAPGESKDAKFEIPIKKSGTTENKFNIAFSPKDGGNGVGLTATVVIIPQGEDDESSEGGFFGGLFGGSDDPEVVEGNQENGEVSVGQDKNQEVVEEVSKSEDKGSTMSLAVLGGTFTIILFVALLILLVVASKHLNKRAAGKSSKDDSEKIGKSSKDDSGPITKSKKKSSKE